jgi:hypothetical protein
MPACGQLACMDSPLGVPGELSGDLLVKRCRYDVAFKLEHKSILSQYRLTESL